MALRDPRRAENDMGDDGVATLCDALQTNSTLTAVELGALRSGILYLYWYLYFWWPW